MVVEDDEALSDNLKTVLAELGDITQVYDGEQAIYELTQGSYDFVVLDLMLPGADGHEVLNKVRQEGVQIPILILTAKEGVENKIRGFTSGADDYLTKPFYREELLLRCKALLRRSYGLFQENQIVYNGLTCDLNQHKAIYQQKEIQLQGKEFDILVFLVQNKERIITKEQIFDRIWGFDSETLLTVVEVYISNLRKHLRTLNLDKAIITVRQVGYLFEIKGSE